MIIFSHDMVYPRYLDGMPNKYDWIVINDEAKIYSGPIILPRVNIRNKAIDSPESVVNRNVLPKVIVAGTQLEKFRFLKMLSKN